VALSDHDDVWPEHRISRAIDQLNNHHADGYSSDVISVDEQLKVKKLIKKSYAQKKYDFIFESPGPGCSFVLTKKLFQFIQTKIDHKTINFSFHDWLIYALARSHGYLWHIDDAPSLFYRQHANNQLGANDGWLAFIKRVQKVLSGQYRRNLTDLHSIIYPGQQPLSLSQIGFYLLNIYYTRRKFIHCLQNFLLLIIISFQKNKTKSF
jgi:rhamnosyltransferase